MAHQNGKKYRSASERRTLGKSYDSKKALELVKEMSFAKFDETSKWLSVLASIRDMPIKWSEAPWCCRQVPVKSCACS